MRVNHSFGLLMTRSLQTSRNPDPDSDSGTHSDSATPTDFPVDVGNYLGKAEDLCLNQVTLSREAMIEG